MMPAFSALIAQLESSTNEHFLCIYIVVVLVGIIAINFFRKLLDGLTAARLEREKEKREKI